MNASPEQARLLSRDRLPLARWIEQHEAGDGGRTRRGVGANEQGTKRVADQHSWSCPRCVGQNAVQFAQHPRHGPRPPTGRAPAQPGAIVRTCAREGRDLGQHARPTQRRRSDPGLEKHLWLTVPCADHVQALPLNADHHARRRISPCAGSCPDELIEDACGKDERNHTDEHDHD